MIITDPKILKQVSRETSFREIECLDLVRRIRQAMTTAWTPGCGLAAIQIGIPLRFAWYRYMGKDRLLINPVILKQWGSDISTEGCLSIPGLKKNVARAVTIEIISNGKKRKVNGFEARIIQHEMDHMDGKLITDKENI